MDEYLSKIASLILGLSLLDQLAIDDTFESEIAKLKTLRLETKNKRDANERQLEEYRGMPQYWLVKVLVLGLKIISFLSGVGLWGVLLAWGTGDVTRSYAFVLALLFTCTLLVARWAKEKLPRFTIPYTNLTPDHDLEAILEDLVQAPSRNLRPLKLFRESASYVLVLRDFLSESSDNFFRRGAVEDWGRDADRRAPHHRSLLLRSVLKRLEADNIDFFLAHAPGEPLIEVGGDCAFTLPHSNWLDCIRVLAENSAAVVFVLSSKPAPSILMELREIKKSHKRSFAIVEHSCLSPPSPPFIGPGYSLDDLPDDYLTVADTKIKRYIDDWSNKADWEITKSVSEDDLDWLSGRLKEVLRAQNTEEASPESIQQLMD